MRVREHRSTRAWLVGLFAALFVLFCGVFVSYSADEIYVAGIPDAWPLESYDRSAKGYEGALTELLSEAAFDAGFSVRYIEPGKEDRRLELARKVQVDAVWTFGLTDEALREAGAEKGEPLFTFTENGEERTVSLAYTKGIAPEMREKLEGSIQEKGGDRMYGSLIRYALEEKQEMQISWVIRYGAPLIMAAALAVLLILPRILARRKRQIEELAYRDDITGGDNFAAWKQKYAGRITDANREHYAVLYLDCGLEDISHIYGYEKAEEAMKIISDACGELIDREREAFARFNDFYFAFLVQYTGIESLKKRALDIENEVKEYFRSKNDRYFLELHMGIYRLQGAGQRPLGALQYSWVAAEYAKNHYLNYALHDEYVEQETVQGYAMEHEAIHGLMNQEFLMYLQPIVNLKDGSICGAEALVRWQNHNRGLLKPEAFMKAVKKKRLTGQMNMEIYRQGCRFLCEEAKKGRKLRLMFNFTVENVGDEQFVDHLEAVAGQYGIDRSQVIIQLNQMVEMSRSERFMDSIRALRKLGFDVCMAGLELDRVFFDYLDCGINGVKLRHELVRQVERSEGKKVLLSVIKLFRSLNLEVFCVGIENQEQEQFLREQGCTVGSGFYFHYPVSPDIFSDLLSERTSAPVPSPQTIK